MQWVGGGGGGVVCGGGGGGVSFWGHGTKLGTFGSKQKTGTDTENPVFIRLGRDSGS